MYRASGTVINIYDQFYVNYIFIDRGLSGCIMIYNI